jgi:HD-GYP domain-containing protein (c-di-GMP phosphodiesterase class II)
LRFPLFRDSSDPDEKRKEILWTAISFIVIFASWLAVVLVFGYQPLTFGVSYDEVVLVTGLGLLLLCLILYLAGREREQRYVNRRLLDRLRTTVRDLDQRIRQLDGLSAISAQLASSLDLDDIAQSAVDAVADSLQAERSCLVLVDEQTGHPVYARRSGEPRSRDEATVPDQDDLWPAPLAAGGHALTDVEAQVAAWNQLSHLISASLRLKSGLTGILAARRPESASPFAADDCNMITTLANMTAKALENAQLHSDLRENYLATVRSLVRSLDARDNYAATHSQRVATLAIRIAEQMGLPDHLIRDLEVFAPLHDVGKIGIRDDILLKKGVLTAQEKDICRQHCLIGDRIIRPLKPSRDALALVRNHHESWDGRGYPDSLAGANIPLLARVVKVADCYDALVTERPYGSVMSEEEALAHFQLHAGSQYDPAVVAGLIAVLWGEAPTSTQEVARTEALRPVPAATPTTAARRAFPGENARGLLRSAR